MMESTVVAETQRRAPAAPAGVPAGLPPQPKTVRDTGLDQALIVELIAKLMYTAGKTQLPVLTGKLRLSINVLREVLDFMLAEQLVEIAWRGDSDLDVQYQLTSGGKLRAADSLSRSRYVGPAPVTLQAYREAVARQSRHASGAARTGAAEVDAVFADDGLEPALREQLGAAMQSSRSLLLYGPSGSGKTTLARKLGQLQQGVIGVPYAILVDQQLIQFYDPLLHLAPSPLQPRPPEDRRGTDTRWALCQRPLVQVGAELSADMLDLRHDQASGVYHAPPHFMANSGILVVDDLGRQRLPVAELLNRWSGPLDAGCDQLTMSGGHKVSVPLDLTLVLVTNLAPQLLLDEAFLRRLGYKIGVGALAQAAYRALFKRQCRQARIACDDAALEHLVSRLHGGSGRAMLASTPRELLARIADFAGARGAAPCLTVATLEQAWTSMFAGCGALSAPSLGAVPLHHASGS
ncbi:MAG: ATP-binding protein [Pseudomonadota bacterium]